jgi:hypothetical protein
VIAFIIEIKFDLKYEKKIKMFMKNQKKCLENLDKRFPESPRVKILKGMKLEAEDKLDDALALYDVILQDDDANIVSNGHS